MSRKSKLMTGVPDRVKVLYIEILSSQVLADRAIEPFEVADLYLIMSHLDLNPSDRLNILRSLVSEKRRSVSELVGDLSRLGEIEHKDEIFFSLIKDVIRISRIDGTYSTEERERVEELVTALFGEKTASVVKLAEKTVELDMALVSGRLSATDLEKTTKEIAANARAAGVTPKALYFSGSIAGLVAASLSLELLTSSAEGIRRVKTISRGLKAVAEFGLTTYVTVRHANISDQREFAVQQVDLVDNYVELHRLAISNAQYDLGALNSKVLRVQESSSESTKLVPELAQELTLLEQSIACLESAADSCLECLVEGLQEDDHEVREQVTSKLALIGKPAAPSIVHLLEERNPETVNSAIEILSRIGAPTFDLLFASFSSRKPALRNGAYDVFVKVGEPAAYYLCNQFYSSQTDIQKFIRLALVEMKIKSIKPLIKMLKQENPAERTFAAETIGLVSDSLIESIFLDWFQDVPKALMKLIEDVGPTVARYVLDSNLKESPVRGTKEERAEIKKRNAAIKKRKKMADKALSGFFAEFSEVLGKPIDSVPGKISDKMYTYVSRVPRRAENPLARALAREDDATAAGAEIIALVKLRSNKAKSLCARLIIDEDQDPELRKMAIRALGELCFDIDIKEVQLLEEVARDDNKELATAARNALAVIRSN